MNLPDALVLELNALCSAAADGILDAPQRARLNSLLAESEEARGFYVRYMGLSASLHDYAGELQVEEPEPPARVFFPPAWRWGLGSLAAAAAVVLAFLLAGETHERAEKSAAAEEESFAATLSATTNCRWTGAAPVLGDELRRGQTMQLDSGLAELTFHSGAQVVLEGPASLDLHSAWEAVLRRGSLRANVPPEAIGFRVTNGDVEVVDLGTEFSMVASEQGGTEVFVLKGAVQAAAPGESKPVTLRERQARRFHRAGITEVRDREVKLKHWAAKSNLLQFTRPAGYLHWSFDEAEGDALQAAAIGWPEAAAEKSAGRLIAGDGLGPVRIPGFRNGSLLLDGRSYATMHAPRILKRAGATLAFWMRLPADAELTDGGPMVALQHGIGGAGARLTWNRDPALGVLGALRTEVGDTPLIGVTTLRDDRWHHVAVVLEAGGRARQYVDGRLEAASAKHPRAKGDRAQKVAGRKQRGDELEVIALGHAFPLESDAGGFFRGQLDELFLADRALTASEIRQLRKENSPAAPQTIADAGLR